jgi:hypothetical protein
MYPWRRSSDTEILRLRICFRFAKANAPLRMTTVRSRGASGYGTLTWSRSTGT